MKILILIAFLLLKLEGYTQLFEGGITYSNTVKSKVTSFSDENLSYIVGTKQEYFISGGNYKSFSDGKSIIMQLYDNLTNRIYNKTASSDTLFWFEASVNTDEVKSFTFKKNIGSILGNSCDAIILITKTGTTTIYYSSKYKLDPSMYSNHKYNNWAFYSQKTGAVPLKTIIETTEFRIESTAIEIKSMKLGSEFFFIDPGVPIKRSL